MSQKEGGESSPSASAAVSLKGVRFKPHSSICAVLYTPPNTHGEGTGALYRPTLLDGQTLDIFMTSYHVLPIKKKEEVIDLVLDFYARSIRDVDVTAEWVEELWFSDESELDITVIVFSKTAQSILRRKNADYLTPGIPESGQTVLVYQYPHIDQSVDRELYTGHGQIEAVEGKSIHYYVDTDPGSSGSPIVNEQGKAVGIHRLGPRDRTVTEKRIGIRMDYILDAFFNYLSQRSINTMPIANQSSNLEGSHYSFLNSF